MSLWPGCCDGEAGGPLPAATGGPEDGPRGGQRGSTDWAGSQTRGVEASCACSLAIDFNLLLLSGSQTGRRHQITKINPQIDRDVVASMEILWFLPWPEELWIEREVAG